MSTTAKEPKIFFTIVQTFFIFLFTDMTMVNSFLIFLNLEVTLLDKVKEKDLTLMFVGTYLKKKQEKRDKETKLLEIKSIFMPLKRSFFQFSISSILTLFW